MSGSSDIDTMNYRVGPGYIFIQGSNGYIELTTMLHLVIALRYSGNIYMSGTIQTTSTATFGGDIYAAEEVTDTDGQSKGYRLNKATSSS